MQLLRGVDRRDNDGGGGGGGLGIGLFVSNHPKKHLGVSVRTLEMCAFSITTISF